ncbi:MAG: hypothetical protein D6712_10860 [Chloroflexi bacterium]|nr:MAG: hypothetical protein D6712_10860 [Chloroflexota bacterium]
MWLITREGFFSAVGDGRNGIRLQARVRQDLEQLRTLVVRPLVITDTPGQEYPCELRLNKVEWLELVLAMAAGVDYPDLAAAVGDDPARREIYLQVWLALRALGSSRQQPVSTRLVEQDNEAAEAVDVEEEAFALLDGLRAGGKVDVGTAVVVLQFHLGLDEETARGYLDRWLDSQ